MSKIDEVVDSITKAVTAEEYGQVDRLQKVLEQLVKVKVAEIEGKKT